MDPSEISYVHENIRFNIISMWKERKFIPDIAEQTLKKTSNKNDFSGTLFQRIMFLNTIL